MASFNFLGSPTASPCVFLPLSSILIRCPLLAKTPPNCSPYKVPLQVSPASKSAWYPPTLHSSGPFSNLKLLNCMPELPALILNFNLSSKSSSSPGSQIINVFPRVGLAAVVCPVIAPSLTLQNFGSPFQFFSDFPSKIGIKSLWFFAWSSANRLDVVILRIVSIVQNFIIFKC